jgi:tetratricopeptide (TPR) repeat protein
MTIMRSPAVMLALVLVLGAGTVAPAAPSVAAPKGLEALRRDAYDAAYNMDYERAVELFRQALAADPNDPAALRGAASVAWLRILFLRGTVLVEDYMGRMSTDDVKMPDPPADLDKSFQQHIDRAVSLAEKAVDQRFDDPSSHYDLSAGLGLAASYAGTIKGSMWSAMRLARRAVSEGQTVLKLDKGRKEAGLIVGTYRYIVSQIPAGLRWLAYIVGFEGGKDEGIRQIEEAARYSSDAQTDARFALVLLYNREKRYADAVTAIRSLEKSYPRNRLLPLEEASTELRANRPAEALKVLDEAMPRLGRDDRPRMAGEEVRWFLKRGIARRQLGMLNEAEADLRAGLSGKETRSWVIARVHLELGKVYDLRGDRAKAKSEYEIGLARARAAGDEEAVSEATRLLAKPYSK